MSHEVRRGSSNPTSRDVIPKNGAPFLGTILKYNIDVHRPQKMVSNRIFLWILWDTTYSIYRGCGHYSIKGPWVYCDDRAVERRRADVTFWVFKKSMVLGYYLEDGLPVDCSVVNWPMVIVSCRTPFKWS